MTFIVDEIKSDFEVSDIISYEDNLENHYNNLQNASWAF
mgnify:CR=1 FL=1